MPPISLRLPRLCTPYFSYLLFRLSYYLLEVPTISIIEHAVCQQLLAGLPRLDETSCKAAIVQERVSTVVGWKMFFDSIPGTLSFRQGLLLSR